VLFTGGLAALSLATVMWIVDFHRVRRYTTLFVIYGINPIVAFIGSAVMARCIYSIFKVTWGGERIPLQEGIYRALFASWLSPLNASLAFAVSFVLLWYGILALLHRRGIILKV
jgi:predicted acyltransferase